MENGFPILMLWFTAAILMYAGLLAWTKDFRLIPRWHVSKRMKDKKGFTVRLAKGMAVIALAPALCGAVGLLLGSGTAFAVLAVAFFFCLRVAVRIIGNTVHY